MQAYIVKQLKHYCNISVKNCTEITSQEINFYDLTFVTKGSMTYFVNGKEIILKENDAVLISPGSVRKRTAGTAPASYVSFNFFVFDDSLMPKNIYMKKVITSDIKKLLSIFSLRHISPAYYAEERVINLLNYILFEIINTLELESSNAHTVKMIKYINSHISEAISLNSVSRHVNLSREYASNIFKKETGKTVNEYINDRKLLLAKEMLQNDEMTLSSISENLGYENYCYFSRIFKRQFGMSPKQYRKTVRMEG